MPVSRRLVEGSEPDVFGYRAYTVTGTNRGETYETRPGDLEINMRGGDDTVRVGAIYYLYSSDDVVEIHGGDGRDVINEANYYAWDRVYGDGGDDTITMMGGGGDRAYGGAGNDTMSTSVGSHLSGGAGQDHFYLTGEYASAEGGMGRDEFHLAAGYQFLAFDRGHSSQGLRQRDVVYDFTPGEDRIDPDINNDQSLVWVGDRTGKDTPIGPGEIGYFRDGEDIIVAWYDGGRQVVELDELAAQGLRPGEGDFWL